MWYRNTTNRRLPAAGCWTALLACIVIAGCVGEIEVDRNATLSDADLVAELVSNMSQACGTPGEFKAIFVAGAAPDESQRSRYSPYLYDAPDADVSGENATAMVRVEKMMDDSLVGEVEWEAVKVGDEWKLKKAPLPAGAK